MLDIKCKGCDKLFGKATIFIGAIKCPRCKMLFEYHLYQDTLHTNAQYAINKSVPTEVQGVKPV